MFWQPSTDVISETFIFNEWDLVVSILTIAHVIITATVAFSNFDPLYPRFSMYIFQAFPFNISYDTNKGNLLKNQELF